MFSQWNKFFYLFWHIFSPKYRGPLFRIFQCTQHYMDGVLSYWSSRRGDWIFFILNYLGWLKKLLIPNCPNQFLNTLDLGVNTSLLSINMPSLLLLLNLPTTLFLLIFVLSLKQLYPALSVFSGILLGLIEVRCVTFMLFQDQTENTLVLVNIVEVLILFAKKQAHSF